MATSRGLKQFGRRMVRVANRYADRVEATVKRVAAQVDRTAVLATPVDTGRARSGWVPSLNVAVEQVREPVEAGGRGSSGRARSNSNLAEIVQRIREYDLDRDHAIFLTNIVSYIGRLNKGSSAQAPAGMTKLAIQAGQETLRKARPLKEATRGN